MPSGISGDDPYDESFMLAAPGSTAMLDRSIVGRDMSGKPTGLRLSQSDLNRRPEDTGTKPVDTSKYKNKGYEGDRDDRDFHEQFSNTTSNATATKTKTRDSAGPRNVGFEEQKDKDEADLSKAYGGGDDGNLGAGKFMNKGGLAKKRKRTTKKK